MGLFSIFFYSFLKYLIEFSYLIIIRGKIFLIDLYILRMRY